MSRKKRNQSFESLQREIARRLKNQLPLAGMIAATSLFCGCDEVPTGRTSGIAPREESPRCEQTSTAPVLQKNDQSEACPNRTMGMPAPKAEPNRQNESDEEVTSGDVPETPPSNEKNEKECPPTPGRTAKTADK
jgi:hypothetical protein